MVASPHARAGLVALSLLCLAGCAKSASEQLEKAKASLLAQRPREALAHYRLALEALKNDQPGSEVLRARALRGAADVYYLELREVVRAAEVYRELISRCPEAPETLEARLFLADILRIHFRDLRGAIGELTAALARNPPQGAEIKYQVAKLYFELSDYQQCALEAEGLARKYETSSYLDDALMLRAQALAMLEPRRAEAARAFEELAQRFPQSELAPHALVELGKLRAEAGEEEAAVAAFVEALRGHPEPQLVQGYIARQRRRLEATTPPAIGDARRAFQP